MAVPVDSFSRTQSAYEWLNRDLKPDFGCDTYYFRDHRRDQTMREYWTNQFGSSRGGEPKGIAVIEIGDGEL